MTFCPIPHYEEALHRLDLRFSHSIRNLHHQFTALLESEPFGFRNKPKRLPNSVVYLFSEDGAPMYVGRSNKFRQRLGNHCRDSSGANQSSFAFKLAREAASKLSPSYSGDGTRKALITDPIFFQGFRLAKTRLNNMEIRFVEEGEQVQQALLEIYCAVALQTPYNEFGTH